MIPTCAKVEHIVARITREQKRELCYLFFAAFLLDVTLGLLWLTEMEFNYIACRRRGFSPLRYTVPLATVVTTVSFVATIVISIKATFVMVLWSECLASLCTLGKGDAVILALIWLLVLHITCMQSEFTLDLTPTNVYRRIGARFMTYTPTVSIGKRGNFVE